MEMDPAPATAPDSTPSSQSQPRPMMLSTAAGSCFVALLAVALTMVWRRKQRWRRTRPWLAKLRAQTASKIEKEPEHKGVRPSLKDTNDKARGKEKLVVSVVLDARSDGGSASGKRTKERRKRGKEAKPAPRSAVLAASAPDSRDAYAEPQDSSTPKPDPPIIEHAQIERSISGPSSLLSPRLIPLPLSPLLTCTPTSFNPPSLVLSGPSSPISTSVSIFATTTELTATTPTTSTSVSPASASPALYSSEATLPAARKLPAFPPASPLPPGLARKVSSLAQRPTPTSASTSTPTPMPNISRKDSHAADRRKEPSRKGTASGESDGPVEEAEFPTLSPWPVVGKQGEAGKRREGRKVNDVGRDGRKAGDVGRGRKPSDARKKAGAGAGAGGVTNPESTQLASLRGALEAARLREEEVAEERRMWAKKERDLQTQIHQLAHQLQAAMMFAGGMQAYPDYAYGYGPMPPTPGPGHSRPQPPAQPQVQSSSEAVSPEKASPAPTSAPVPSSDASSVPSTPALQPPQAYPHMYLPLPFPPPFPMFAPPPHGSPMSNIPPPHASPLPMHGSPMPSPMPAQPPMMPMPMMSPPHGPLSPPQPHTSPFILSHPWRGAPGSTPGPMTGMNPGPGPGGMNAGMMHPVPGRRPNGFFASSPQRGGSRSRSPYIHAWGDQQRKNGNVTPSTGSVGSVDDGLFGSSVVHPPPATLGSLKRERERDEEEEEDEGSSSEESEEEDSDDDSVIFEDGSVSDSVNLSLHGDNKEPGLVSLPVEIRIGEDTC